jgi:hypothetical protein
MENESKPLNSVKKVDPSLSLFHKIKVVGILGWVAAAFFAITNLVTVGFFMTREVPWLAVDELGRPIGTVVMNDAELRDDATVRADLVRWVQAATSYNSATIYEDALIAVNHFCEELRDEKLAEWKETGFLSIVEETKSISNVVFYDGYPIIARNKDRFEAEIKLKRTIGVSGKPELMEFKVKGKLLKRSEEHTLGMEICSNESA